MNEALAALDRTFEKLYADSLRLKTPEGTQVERVDSGWGPCNLKGLGDKKNGDRRRTPAPNG